MAATRTAPASCRCACLHLIQSNHSSKKRAISSGRLSPFRTEGRESLRLEEVMDDSSVAGFVGCGLFDFLTGKRLREEKLSLPWTVRVFCHHELAEKGGMVLEQSGKVKGALPAGATPKG